MGNVDAGRSGGPGGARTHGMPQQLHLGGPGGPQKLTLPPPQALQKPPEPGAAK